MPLLPDVYVIFFRLIVVLTPNEQFLDCATIAFSGRYAYVQEYGKLQTPVRFIQVREVEIIYG
jgi:hypothetical protein